MLQYGLHYCCCSEHDVAEKYDDQDSGDSCGDVNDGGDDDGSDGGEDDDKYDDDEEHEDGDDDGDDDDDYNDPSLSSYSVVIIPLLLRLL